MWGNGWYGKLGLGGRENHYTPQRLVSLQYSKIVDLSCGSYHVLAADDSGVVFAWGRGDERLGIGDGVDHLTPKVCFAVVWPLRFTFGALAFKVLYYVRICYVFSLTAATNLPSFLMNAVFV